jgi:hypothetical protein
VWRFLSHLKFWQAVCLGLLCVIVAQHFTLAGERRHSAKVEAQLAKSQAELQRITTARSHQKDISQHTVAQVIQGQERVKTVVKTIHDAPNPPDCRTPELPEAARRVL